MKIREIRDLVFMGVAIVMAVVICVTNMAAGNMFGVFVSIMLLAVLSAGIGYLYCRHEEKVSEALTEMPKLEIKPMEQKEIKEFAKKLGGAVPQIIRQAEVEVKKVEDDSTRNQNK